MNPDLTPCHIPLDPAIFYPHFSPRGFLPPLICTKYFVTCVPVSLDPWSVLVPADLDPVEHLVVCLVQFGSSESLHTFVSSCGLLCSIIAIMEVNPFYQSDDEVERLDFSNGNGENNKKMATNP